MNQDSLKSEKTFSDTGPQMLSSMAACTCGENDSLPLPDLDQPFVTGAVKTPAGEVPQVSALLTAADHWGSIKARWGVGRMHYTVQPGLYAIGEPDENAPVLVTANYKMSFDRLRRVLVGRDGWILVLDTKGINVWCAAGKGTFGTDELLGRIAVGGLSRVVANKTLIVPQLGAPGVAAHQVRKLSGFKVIYGPVLAEDLPAFLDCGLKASAKMRQKTFTTRERMVLVPVELVSSLKKALIILTVFFLLSGLAGPGSFWSGSVTHGLVALYAILGAILAGAVLTPLLLPWLPGRAFALKGLWAGFLTAALLAVTRWPAATALDPRLEILAWVFMISAASAYLGMNFTGSSTYTSLSGVKREMRRAIPLEIAAGVVGVGLWATARFIV